MPEQLPPSREQPSEKPRARLFYGWVVVAIAFVTMGIGVNTRTSFSLLFPPILQEFGWSRAVTAGAFSVGFVVSAALGTVVGVFMDRIGPRFVLPFGTIVVSTGLVLATGITEPWHLQMTLGVLVVGGAVIFSYIGHSMFLPNWFVRRRGLAIGIAFSGVGVGSMVLFPLLQRLIDAMGWRPACGVLAVLLVAIVAPLNFILQRQHPGELDLQPDGDPTPPAGTAPKADHSIVDRNWAETEWTLLRAMGTSRFWWLGLAYFSGLFGWYAVQVHQTQYLIEVGVDAQLAATALGMVGLMGIGGQIGLGWLSDRIGREWVWSIATGGFALCYLLLLAMQSYPSSALMYAMVAAQGLLGYGLASVYGAIPAELYQGRRLATIFGVVSLAASLGAGAGPWAAGLLQDLTGTYVEAFWLAFALCLVSMLAIWPAAPRKVRLVSGRAARRTAAVKS